MILGLSFYTLNYIIHLKKVEFWNDLNRYSQDLAHHTNSDMLFLPYKEKHVSHDSSWWFPIGVGRCRFSELLVVPLYNTNQHNRSILERVIGILKMQLLEMI